MVQNIARIVPFAMDSPSLTILIPCLNEELGIAAVVREYGSAFPQADILVVDNGSEDSTAVAAKGAGAGFAATIPAGMRAFAVHVNEVVGVAGFAVTGMHVDLLVSGTPPGVTPEPVPPSPNVQA